MGRRGRALRLALAASFAALLGFPSAGECSEAAAAVLAPYFARGPGEVTTLSVRYADDSPGLLQVHVRSSNGSPFRSEAAGAASTSGTFSFSCAVPPRSGSAPRTVPIAIAREDTAGPERLRISAECAAADGSRVEKRYEFLPEAGQASGVGSGLVFVGLLDPSDPTTTRIADLLSAEWSYLNLSEGVGYASEARGFPSGSQGDAAAGAGDFSFRFDGAELATVSLEPSLGDRDADGDEDFVDLCPDVPDQDDDQDADGDGVPDACDPCSLLEPESAPDADGDGIPDACDESCPCFGVDEILALGGGTCTDLPAATLYSAASGSARAYSPTLSCQWIGFGAYRSGFGSEAEIGACRDVLRDAAARLGRPCP